MKTINPKSPTPETKVRALTRALAYMMADRYISRRREEWQAGFELEPDPRLKRRRK